MNVPITSLTTVAILSNSQNDERKNDNGNRLAVIVGSIGGVIGVICLVLIAIMIRRRIKNKKNVGLNKVELKLRSSSKPNITNKEIPILENITIQKKLGGGNFGEVYLGNWSGTEVALKKMKNAEDFASFEKEAAFLLSLGNHPFVVQFLGKFISKNEQFIVTEYVQMGSLSEFLVINKNTLTFADLFHMIWTAAKGMAFLERKKVVHRDLAARNFLVTQINGKYCVKISDFGMSRETDNYYKSSSYEVPIRWCAPEVLSHRTFSVASDVWSFAVAVWEILNFGTLPYYWLNNKDIAIKIIDENERLRKPAICPPEVWNIFEECFNFDPLKRPSFANILDSLNLYNASSGIVEQIQIQEEPQFDNLDAEIVTNYVNC